VLTHFTAIEAGVMVLRDVIFFFSLIALFLAGNIVIVDLKKTG
jgi:ABC-2 type transport system permease protein